MEARKITIVSTKNQRKHVIMSSATTIAELKSDLRQNNIDYDGMTFYEGTSKTELKDNSSVLPHDVPYKGQITNELVFMLTNPNKKIKSGMNRSEAYTAIKAHNLQAECVKRFGKNFTMCKTDNLITLINEKLKPIPLKEESKEGTIVKEESVKKDEKEMKESEAKKSADTECTDHKLRHAFSALLTILSDAILEEDEVEDIKAILDEGIDESKPNGKHSPVSPYSKDEIDEMFNFVK